jgi:glycosyltransferase involved in cell wall biosynthesis
MRIGYDCVGPIDADLAAAARQKASGLGIGSDLNLPGRLAARDAWRIIAGCQVGLALLAPIPNYIESFPTKMFEYMALGIPVIVSDFPAYRAVIEKWDCGLVVDPTDPEAIAKALESLLANPDRRHSMGVRGSQAALDHYSWKSEERKLIDFYGQLLGLRNPANGSGRAR